MWGLIGFALTISGFILFFLPIPLPLFVSPAIALTGLSVVLSQKKQSKGEKNLSRYTIAGAIVTTLMTVIYYAILYFGLNILN
jgi:hypothetical protein